MLCAVTSARMFGLTVGLIGLLIHLGGLESFGLGYLRPFDRAEIGGVVLRRRLKEETYRDPGLRPENLRKQE